MMFYSFQAASLGIAVLIASAQTSQQSSSPITSEVSCPTCAIDLELVASLGRPEDPVLPLPTARIARDSFGRFYAAPTFDRGKIAVYDASGTFLEAIGREGQGPGEFRQITSLVVDSEDALHVFERSRHTILSADTHELRLVHTLQGNPGSIIEVSSGQLVVQQLAAAPGSPLIAVVDAEGDVITSFLPIGDTSDRWDRVRVLGRSTGDRVWVAPKNEFRIELWSLNGVRLLVLERDADFFEPWRGYDRLEPARKPPRPRVHSVHQDAAGRVWVMIAVAAEDWAPAPAAAEGPVTGQSTRARLQLWDTIIEVLDPSRGTVLARRRVSGLLPTFKGASGLIHTVRASADVDVIDVWQPRLEDSR